MTSFRALIHEIHRRSLWQVLGIYALACWVIWQVVVSLYEGIGLPDWVPASALILLLIGLPVVLATAFVQEGGSGPASDTRPEARHPAPAARGPEPQNQPPATDRSNTHDQRPTTLFTWPRALTFGVLAFAMLGLATTGFMGMRALGIGPAATLISSGALEKSDIILLAEFRSLTGDSILALTVTEGLRVGLEQSDAVRLAGPDLLRAGLLRMRRDPAQRMESDLARELARREGIKAVVEGDISTVGGSFALTARVVSAETGGTLVSVREVARDSSELIGAIDAVAVRIRERAGESLRHVRQSPPLTQVTTSSLDALRKYSEGLRAWYQEADSDRALLLLEEAIALDSAFAMAWRAWGIQHLGRDRAKNIQGLTRAYELADRLPERERYHVLGTYYSDVVEDHQRAIDAYQTVLRLYPDDTRSLHNIAREYWFQGRWDEAARWFERRIEVDPNSGLMWQQYPRVLAGLGRWEDFDSAHARYAALFPEHPQVQLQRASLGFLRNDDDGVTDAADSLARAHPRPAWQAAAHGIRARLALRLGQVAEAREHFERRQRTAADDGAPGYVRAALEIATAELLVLGHVDRALAVVDRALEAHPLDSMPPLDRPSYDLALFYATAGETAKAEQLLAEARRTISSPGPADEIAGLYTTAVIALNEGRTEEGLAAADAMVERFGCGACLAVELARFYDEAGQTDHALELYLEGLEYGFVTSGFYGFVNRSSLILAPIHGRVAQLLEESGREAEAARHYAALVELWQNADPELQPRVEAARRALTRLSREGRESG